MTVLSDRGVLRARGASVLGIIALATGLVGAAGTREPEPRFSGEYGLFVHYDSSEISVGWITAGLQEGRLILLAGRDTLATFDTPESRSHVAAFPRPTGDAFTLEYGSAPDTEDWHRTDIDLRRGERPVAPAVRGADSIYVIGDTHGEFDAVRQLLENAGLIDAEARWSGGTRHLVFLGDLFDRGDDVTALLWFVYRLEREAEAAGGQVHVVLGNHEIMVMSSDLRYVARKERMLGYLHEMPYSELFSPRRSVLGRWLATKPAVLKIDEVLLAHGGVSVAYLDYSLQDFRDTLTSYMSREYFGRWDDTTFWATFPREAWPDTAAYGRHWDFFWDPKSVFWYRGYLTPGPEVPVTDSSAGGEMAAYGSTPGAPGAADSVARVRAVVDSIAAAHVAKVLARYGADVHVIGHTTVEKVEQRFGGSLIGVDLEAAGTEMLLLARTNESGRRERLRFTLEGPPVALGADPTGGAEH